MSENESLHFLINHLIFPPRLPQDQEANLAELHDYLLKFIHKKAEEFQQCLSSDEDRWRWATIVKMLRIWKEATHRGTLSPEILERYLISMKSNDTIALYIKAQNAGLIFRKSPDGLRVTVDSFEASPKTEAVINSQRSLLCTFPNAKSVEISSKLLEDRTFVHEVASLISELNNEEIEEAKNTARKARENVAEEREVRNPKFVGMLMAIFLANGSSSPAHMITKRIRDDVCWKSALIPWRRSALWTTVRVALQIGLIHLFPNEPDHRQYKNFILFTIASICKNIRDQLSSHQLSNHLLHAAHTKLVHRISKAGFQVLDFVDSEASEAAEAASSYLDEHLISYERNQVNYNGILNLAPSVNEVNLELSSSQDRISKALSRHSLHSSSLSYSVSPLERLSFDSDGLPHPILISAAPLVLLDFESWVQEHLHQVTHSIANSLRLKELLDSYYTAATKLYSSISEQNSLMILTLLSLWVAIDKMLLREIPIMEKFSPELPIDIAQPLLLPKLSQMKCLADIEKYLSKRHAECNNSNPSHFSKPSVRCFAVQYYDLHSELSKLRSSIESAAHRERADREKLWQTKNNEYNSLIQRFNSIQSCTMFTGRWGESSHSRDCQKCALKYKAEKLEIHVHEWPLPEAEDSQIPSLKTVIFELSCPKSYTAWRDITWKILKDLGERDKVLGDAVKGSFQSLPALNSAFIDHSQRIRLYSKVKSWASSHYSNSKFPTSFEDICKRHALRWQLYDNEGAQWTCEQESNASISSLCITLLTGPVYTPLQPNSDSTYHTTNETLAKQEACHRDLTLHEFQAFCDVRYGEKTQWYEILLELSRPVLTLNTEAVSSHLLQAAIQAGSRSEIGNPHRISHELLVDQVFAKKLLDKIYCIKDSISANWKEVNVMTILINLVLRVLQLTTSNDIENTACQVLNELRNITLKWMRTLSEILSQQTEERSRTVMQRKLLKCACLCRQTFDLDIVALDRVLSEDDNIAIFVEAATIVHDNTPGSSRSLDSDLQRSLFRDRRIAHQLQDKICSLALERPASVTSGIERIWPEFSTSGAWSQTLGSRQAWISVKTNSSQTVNLNIFSGELLVNGQHLRTLPCGYMEHNTYIRILHAQILQVIPSNVPYMNYMTLKPISGHTVYFGMDQGEIIIRAKNVICGDTVELIPDSCFHGDIPHFMISRTAQWLDIKTQVIHFCPLSSIWDTTASYAQLHFPSKRMLLAGKNLVEYESPTGKQILDIFSPIEQKKYILITMDSTQEHRVEAKLQRFGITFFLNKEGELQSNDLAAIIDADQRIGSFIGLRSRIVLRHLPVYSGTSNRSVIVPFGEVSLEVVSGYTQVDILVGEEQSITWFRWEIDTILRQLKSRHNAILSRLFQLYLHAITAHCRADPLTGRTGTEEAIFGLRQPALLPHAPFNHSSPEDVYILKLLSKIAELTPARNFYPTQLKKMQTVLWNDQLSPLAQHDEFVVLANRIITHSNRLSILSIPQISVNNLKDRGEDFLLQKASIRNASLRPREFGGDLAQNAKDEHYTSQDASGWSSSADKTFQIASLVNRWPSQFYIGADLRTLLHNWGNLSYEDSRTDQYPFSKLLHLQLKNHWGSLYNMSRRADMSTWRYRLMFLFGKIAFGDADLSALRFLLAVAVSSETTFEAPPGPKYYKLGQGSKPKKDYLADAVKPFFREYYIDAQSTCNREFKQIFIQDVKSQIQTLVTRLQSQWPVRAPVVPPTTGFSKIMGTASIHELGNAIQPFFTAWFDNYEFEAHLGRITTALSSIHIESSLPLLPQILIGQKMDLDKNCPPYVPRCISSLCNAASGYAEPRPTALFTELPLHTITYRNTEIKSLESLTLCFTKSSNKIDRIFGKNMAESVRTLENLPVTKIPTTLTFPVGKISDHATKCRDYVDYLFKMMVDEMDRQGSQLYRLQKTCGLSPRITPTSFLCLIATSNPLEISAQWKALILQYGVALTILQRAKRLERLARLNDIPGFYEEMGNRGHENWEPAHYPDWLLMEIEGGFLIRPIQAEVALSMISPESGRNTLMQLNMGEGKSAVIIPLTAAVLANGKNLARIIVLKALVSAMSSTLKDRLGHLVNRTIFYCPFSRRTKLSNQTLERLFSLWDECCKSRGVLLTQPEHILSFKLIGVEQISRAISEQTEGHYENALKLLTKRRYWEKNGRNIIDESDAVLDAKYQLIYTTGMQQAVDGNSDRWQLIQELLTLVSECAQKLPQGEDVKIIYRHDKSSFPELLIRQGKMSDKLIDLLAENIVDGNLRGLHFQDCTPQILQVKAFIRDPELSHSAQETTIQNFHGTRLKKVLLLRGLIAGGVLNHCLYNKRWNVEFGLDKTRLLLAVPYIAKGVPSPSAEFGHPDVAITLTCLSYYMTGLSDTEIGICFDMLYKSADPRSEYRSWGRCACRLADFADLQGVNLEDQENIKKNLYPHLKYDKATIDFFMSHAVFPKDCKEFPKKLTTSAWDIPSGMGLTTGFSGTNDNRYLLPLSVVQEDSPNLVHTSALVMSYILRPENSYKCVKDDTNQRLSVQGLVDFLAQQTPAIHVLIDVGAQVLELGNKEVVTVWLSKMTLAEAAVYFDENDKPCVVTRDGQTEFLSMSRYQDRLEHCVVYLDEVHTRGTDLRLPANFRAAVTLGPRVTKDRFAQGCMRMRGLGKGQSILILADPEVDRDLRELAATTEPLSPYHALQWCLEQTRHTIKRNQPLWVHHGLTYYSNKYAEEQFFANLDTDINPVSTDVYRTLLEAVQEDDAITLLDMYGSRTSKVATRENLALSNYACAQKLLEVRQAIGADHMRNSAVNEEQEKEITHEKEVQTEVQRPLPAFPLPHASHEEIREFIRTGYLDPVATSKSFLLAFEIFSTTSADLHGTIVAPEMIATRDFAYSIKSAADDKLDEYLKPTTYILTRKTGIPVLVFISQYEANHWLEEINVSKAVCMHIYSPKTTREMMPLNDLKLFVTPSTTTHFQLTTDLRLQLGIFSGQLYLNSYEDYKRLRELLSECFQPPKKKTDERSEAYNSWVKNEMLEFVRSIFEIRRKGEAFSRSHMGRIVNGEILTKQDFDP